jgi:hypothetical protein
MKTLTAKWLDEHDACPSSLERFRRLFGNECQVTEANVELWLRTRNFWYAEDSARGDLAWLVLRLVGKRCNVGFHTGQFFSTPLAAEVLRYLKIKRRAGKAYHVMDAIQALPTHRLARAVSEIAERSPEI